MRNKIRAVRLKNILSNEIWICDDYTNIREIDGVNFLEVHKENSFRKLWIRKDSLIKVKANFDKVNWPN
jgi:hypothetical protein